MYHPEGIDMERKQMTKEIERLMKISDGKIKNERKKNIDTNSAWKEGYFEGKTEGLNIAWKMLNGTYIKEEEE